MINYKDCLICGSSLPSNLMEEDFMASVGIVYICPKCYDTVWDKDDKDGYSLKKKQGWTKWWQDYKDAQEAL